MVRQPQHHFSTEPLGLFYLFCFKFENVLVCSQDFHEEDYKGLVICFEQIEMTRAIGGNDLKSIKEVRAMIKKYNPDIVYAHSSKAGAIVRAADIGLKNRCIYNPHGWAFNMRCSAKKKAMYTAIEKVKEILLAIVISALKFVRRSCSTVAYKAHLLPYVATYPLFRA